MELRPQHPSKQTSSLYQLVAAAQKWFMGRASKWGAGSVTGSSNFISRTDDK